MVVYNASIITEHSFEKIFKVYSYLRWKNT
jgi:hypothetical protein